MQDSPIPYVTRPEPQRPPAHIAYSGDFGDVWKLAASTTFLTFITLGIYRFWAKTRMRGYFWSHISVEDEPLEYTGNGLELFKGALFIFLVVLLPIYIAFIAVEFLLVDSPEALGILQILAFLLFLTLTPIAVYRARRYRLSRTSWRGIRGGLSGDTWSYVQIAVGYGFLGFLSLGLLRPLVQQRTTSYLMNHTWFGDGRFGFDAKARPLFGRWFLVWVCSLVAIVPPIVAVVLYGTAVADSAADFHYKFRFSDIVGSGALPYFLVGFVGVVAWGAAYVHYRVFKARHFTSGTVFEGVRFHSELRTQSVLAIALIYGATALAILTLTAVFGFGVGIFLGFFVVATMVAPFITHPVLRAYIGTLSTHGEIDLEALMQSQQRGPGHGEGLADALDIGGI